MSSRFTTARDLLVICTVSMVYEWFFLRPGLNEIDEGWPLYAAMQLHHGRALYQDIFFVFPPGHLLCAWLAYALDPPGVILSRVFYSSFTVALCAVLYLLARRLMPAGFALVGCLMVAICSPISHLGHHLFAYRYLVFSVVALLCFSRRTRGGGPRWMGAAGILTGVALCFRLTPAFAVACGIAVGIVAANRDWRRWLTDGVWYGAGILVVVLPVLGWLLGHAPAATLFREVVVRPVHMTALQELPVPPLFSPPDGRKPAVAQFFAALLFRVVPIVYLAYVVPLGVRWLRCLRQGRPFDAACLLAVVVFGSMYFLRSFGRADEAHLASATPPFCLLAAHALSLAFRPGTWKWRCVERIRPIVAFTAGAALLAAWVSISDWGPALRWHKLLRQPAAVLNGAVKLHPLTAMATNRHVRKVVKLTTPEERVLILGANSVYHVLADRLGPGRADVLMPGTFLDESEELLFVEHLNRAPPALIIHPSNWVDKLPERNVERTAPQVVAWVEQNYKLGSSFSTWRFYVQVPREHMPQ